MKQAKQSSTLNRTLITLGVVGSVLLASGLYQRFKPLPSGISQKFQPHKVNNAQFFADYTYLDSEKNRHSDQSIFDEAFRLINQANKTILIDMFLFNDFQGAKPEHTRAIANELTQALIARKKAIPKLKIIFISDPINSFYGGSFSPHLNALKQAGIQVVYTDLSQLRASNASWSGFWSLTLKGLGNTPQNGWLPNAIGPGKVTLRSYLSLLNFKANHRKTLVVDEGAEWTALVMSANPHDGSSAHGNVALRFQGQAVHDLMLSELAVVRMSGQTPLIQPPVIQAPGVSDPTVEAAKIQIITEANIRNALLAAINNSEAGNDIRMAIFYFSHRPLVNALKKARQRGVAIRVLMDPNKDAFGREKNGIPNRQVAMELNKAGIPVRWCDTHGEQCHSKLTLITGEKGQLILGSANYTRRNLDDLNLETSVLLQAPLNDPVIQAADQYFETLWNNTEEKNYSSDYTVYADHSQKKYWQYRLMEWSGWSTF